MHRLNDRHSVPLAGLVTREGDLRKHIVEMSDVRSCAQNNVFDIALRFVRPKSAAGEKHLAYRVITQLGVRAPILDYLVSISPQQFALLHRYHVLATAFPVRVMQAKNSHRDTSPATHDWLGA